jgi:hypothetical protein
VPAGHQRAGTQWRAIAGFSLNIRLLGDFERIIHFDAQITQMCSCTFALLCSVKCYVELRGQVAFDQGVSFVLLHIKFHD